MRGRVQHYSQTQKNNAKSGPKCNQCELKGQKRTKDVQQNFLTEQNCPELYLYTTCEHFLCFACTTDKISTTTNFSSNQNQTSIQCCNKKTILQQKTMNIIGSKLQDQGRNLRYIQALQYKGIQQKWNKNTFELTMKDIQNQSNVRDQNQSRRRDQNQNLKLNTNTNTNSKLSDSTAHRVFGVVRRRQNINQRKSLQRKSKQKSKSKSRSRTKSKQRQRYRQQSELKLRQWQRSASRLQSNSRSPYSKSRSISQASNNKPKAQVSVSVQALVSRSPTNFDRRNMTFNTQNINNLSHASISGLSGKQSNNVRKVPKSSFKQQESLMKQTFINELSFTQRSQQTNLGFKDYRTHAHSQNQNTVAESRNPIARTNHREIKKGKLKSSLQKLEDGLKISRSNSQRTNSLSKSRGIKDYEFGFELSGQPLKINPPPLVTFSRQRYRNQYVDLHQQEKQKQSQSMKKTQKQQKFKNQRQQQHSECFQSILAIQIERVRGEFNYLHNKLRFDQQEIVNNLFQFFQKESTLSFHKYEGKLIQNPLILEDMANKMGAYIDSCKIPSKLLKKGEIIEKWIQPQTKINSSSTWISKGNQRGNKENNQTNAISNFCSDCNQSKNQVKYSRSTGNLLQKLDYNQERMKQALSRHYVNFF